MEFRRPGDAEQLRERFGENLGAVVERVADYMQRVPVVVASPALGPSGPVSHALRSDGRYIWTSAGIAAVRDGRVAVPTEFAGDGDFRRQSA